MGSYPNGDLAIQPANSGLYDSPGRRLIQPRIGAIGAQSLPALPTQPPHGVHQPHSPSVRAFRDWATHSHDSLRESFRNSELVEGLHQLVGAPGISGPRDILHVGPFGGGL